MSKTFYGYKDGIEFNKNIRVSKYNLPLFSIITVVFNSENYIEKTINSVLEQTYDNYEYIIIDGGSTDKNDIDVYLQP